MNKGKQNKTEFFNKLVRLFSEIDSKGIPFDQFTKIFSQPEHKELLQELSSITQEEIFAWAGEKMEENDGEFTIDLTSDIVRIDYLRAYALREKVTDLKIEIPMAYIQAEKACKWLQKRFSSNKDIHFNLSRVIEDNIRVIGSSDDSEDSFEFTMEEMQELCKICSLAEYINFYTIENEHDRISPHIEISFPTVQYYTKTDGQPPEQDKER